MAYRTCLYDLLQRKIHPCIACNQMPIECFAILELHEHGVALRSCEETEGKLSSSQHMLFYLQNNKVAEAR